MSNRLRYALLIASLLLIAAPVLAFADSRVLVQRVEAAPEDAQLARSMEEALVFELGKRDGLDVVSPAELEQTVKLAELQTELGCDAAEECLTAIQEKLRVQRLIAGKLSRLGGKLILSLGVVDLRNKAVGKRVAREGATYSELVTQLAVALDELLGVAEPKPQFRLAGGQRLKLAVMPLVARGVKASTADAMSQILATELNRIDGIHVISRDDIRAMLDKVATEGELGCTDNLDCIVEIGASLGLAKLVTGSVGKLKDMFVISMQLIDTRNAVVENRVLETFEGDPEELRHAVKLSAYQLAGVDYAQRKGRIDFTFNVADASVRVGERAGKLEDHRLRLDDLAPGRYSLRVLADPSDYYPLQTDVYVAPNGDNVRTFRISDKPSPWYEKWWVWTVAGVVVAGAATSVAVLATRNSNPATATGAVVIAKE